MTFQHAFYFIMFICLLEFQVQSNAVVEQPLPFGVFNLYFK